MFVDGAVLLSGIMFADVVDGGVRFVYEEAPAGAAGAPAELSVRPCLAAPVWFWLIFSPSFTPSGATSGNAAGPHEDNNRLHASPPPLTGKYDAGATLSSSEGFFPPTLSSVVQPSEGWATVAQPSQGWTTAG